jgi:hypothetical protein
MPCCGNSKLDLLNLNFNLHFNLHFNLQFNTVRPNLAASTTLLKNGATPGNPGHREYWHRSVSAYVSFSWTPSNTKHKLNSSRVSFQYRRNPSCSLLHRPSSTLFPQLLRLLFLRIQSPTPSLHPSFHCRLSLTRYFLRRLHNGP